MKRILQKSGFLSLFSMLLTISLSAQVTFTAQVEETSSCRQNDGVMVIAASGGVAGTSTTGVVGSSCAENVTQNANATAREVYAVTLINSGSYCSHPHVSGSSFTYFLDVYNPDTGVWTQVFSQTTGTGCFYYPGTISFAKQSAVSAIRFRSSPNTSCGMHIQGMGFRLEALEYEYSINGGASYQLSNIFTGLTPGTYNVIVKDGQGTASATQSIQVASSPDTEVNAGNDVSIVEGASVQLNATGNNPGSSTTAVDPEEFCVFDSGNQTNCTQTNSLCNDGYEWQYNGNSKSSTINTSAQQGVDELKLKVFYTCGESAFGYNQWDLMVNGVMVGSTGQTSSEGCTCSPTGFGTYPKEFTFDNSSLINQAWNAGGNNNVQVIYRTNGTRGIALAAYQIEAVYGAVSGYTWAPTTGLSAANIANPIASPTETTTYTVTYSDKYGCTDTDEVTVTVNPPFSSSVNVITSEADLQNDGLLIEAANVGSGATALQMNGICFSNSASSIGGMTNGGGDFCTDCTPGTSFDNMMSSLVFEPSGAASSLNINGLTVGNRHRLQVYLSNDVNGTGSNMTFSLEGNTVPVSGWRPNTVAVVIDFVASATSMNMVITADGNRAVLNGYALHDLDQSAKACNAAPVAVSQGDIVAGTDASGDASITFDGTNSTDDLAVVNYAWSIDGNAVGTGATLGVDLNIGSYSGELVVTDGFGLSNSQTFNITINDATDPVVITRDITVPLDANGNATITAQDIDNGSSDISGPVTLSLDQTDFDCSDLGGGSSVLSFNGSNAYTTIASATLPETNFTLEYWFQTNESNASLFEVNYQGHDRNMYLSNGVLRARLWSEQTISSNVGNLNDGEWHHVSWTVQSGVGQRLYVDGTLVASGSKGESNFNWAARFFLGYTVYAGVNNGHMDEFRLWNRVLSTTEMDGLRNKALDGDENGLLVYYDFEASTGSGAYSDKASLGGDNYITAQNNTSITTNGSPVGGGDEVTLTVTDATGNSATGTAIVTIIDNIKPVIPAQQNVTVELGDSYTEAGASATDNCGNIAATVGGDAVDTNQVGTYIVTYDAADASGNAADQVTKTVTVVDTTDPEITVNNVTVNNDAGECGAIVPGFGAGAADISGTATITYSIAEGSSFNVGTTQVTATATDASGNSASATFDVTVLDAEAPVMPTLADITEECAANVAAPTTTDNCGAVITGTTTDPTEFTEQGSFTINWTFTDTAGNSTTAVQNVTIEDITPPVITQPANVTVDTDAGFCGAEVTVPVPQTSDNCVASGTVLNLDGQNDFVEVLHQPALASVNYTAEAWIYVTGGNSYKWIFGKRTPGDGWNMYVAPGGNLQLWNGWGVPINGPNVPFNQWVHVAATGSSSGQTLYMNGQVVGTTTTVVSPSSASTNFTIGVNNDGNSPWFFGGNMRNVRFWNVELNQAQVQANMNSDTVASQAGLVLNFPMNDGIADGDNTGAGSLIDQSGNGFNGLFRNFNLNGSNSNFVADPDAPSSVSLVNDFNNSGNASGFYPLGTTTVTWTATDAAGNTSTLSQDITVEDNTAPVVVGKAISVTLTASGTVSILPTDVVQSGSDECGPVTYTVSQDTFGATDAINSPVTIQLTGTDPNNNSTTVPVQVTVIDPVPVVNTKDIVVQLDETGNVTIQPTDVDDGSTSVVGIQSYSLDIDTFDCSNVNNPVTVTLTVTSTLGSSATGTAVVTVEDNVKPTVITKDITVQLDASGNATITADDINNGSNDACGILSTMIDVSSFDCSDINQTNTVTLTVTDVNGNVETGTAIVTVEDNVKPTVITKDITVQLDASGNASITAGDINNGSSDACGIQSTSIDVSSFDCSDINQTNTVTLTVTDVNGNVETGTANVTVLDSVKPTVVTKDITVQLDASGNASITAADINNGSSDACGILSTSIDVSSFDCSDINQTNTVTLTVTDNNGNVEIGTAIVTVEDNVKPIVVTKDITVQLDASGNASITPAMIDNGSSDNCEIASMTLSQTDFTCEDVGQSGNGYAMNFNPGAGTGFRTVNNAALPTGNSARTFSAWVKFDSRPNTWGAIMHQGNGDCTRKMFGLGVIGGRLAVWGGCHDYVTGMSVPTGQWIHVAATYNGNGLVTAYLNGQGQSRNMGSYATTLSRLFVGVETTNNGGSYRNSIDGKVDEVKVFNRALSASEIQAEMAGNNPAANSLVSYYPFEEGQGNTVEDVVGNNEAIAFGVGSSDWVTDTAPVNQTSGNEVTLTVTDVNGNVETGTAIVTVEDNVKPTVITKDITVQLDASGNATITADDINNGSNDACGIESTTIDVSSFDCSDINQTNTVTLTVTDVNGNVETGTAIVTVEDNVKPTVITKDITVQLDASGNATITANDINNGSNDACGILSTMIDVSSFDCSDINQTNTVTLTVTDNNGNVETGTANVTVLDTVKPTVITKDITVQLDASGNATITADDINNGSNDACGILSTTIDVSSFDCSNINLVNTVTLTVTDNNGNVETGTAIVTVEDNVKPNVVTRDITIALDANGQVSITPADIDNGSDDACGIANLSVDISNFDCTVTGPNVVTLTVTDVNGNSDSATATVTVIDNISPTVITKNITVALDANGEYTITPEDVNNGSYDNCSFTLSLDNDSFNCQTLGENTVMLTATDASNNSTTEAAIVTVIDNAAPTIVTNPITVQLDENGQASIIAAQVDGGTYDNCAVATVTIDIDSFTCDDLGDNTVTITATDVNGNSSTATVNVEVEDIIPPTVGVQSISVDLDENGNATITPEDVLLFTEDDVRRDTECNLASSTDKYVMKVYNNDRPANSSEMLASKARGNSLGQYKGKGKGKKKDDDDDDGGKDDDDDDDGGKKKYARFVYSGGKLLKRLDGSLQLNGTLVNESDPNDSYALSMELTGAYDYESWRAMDGKVKEVDDALYHLDWTYYRVSGGSLTGTGINTGQSTAITAYNEDEGFQLGDWANIENGEEGLRGKFRTEMGKAELRLDITDCALLPIPEGTVYTSDNCTIVDFSFDQDSFTCNDLTETTVNLTATDQSGNTTTVPVTVMVNDPIAPMAVAQDITVSLGADGTVTVDAALLDGGSTDNTNCGLTFSLDRDTFDCDDITADRHSKGKGKGHNYDDDDDDNDPGNGKAYGHKKGRGHKVTLTVTDAAGNTDTAEAYIKVVDDMAPVISSEPVTIVVYDKKKEYLKKYDVEPAVSDNCGVKSVDFPKTRYTTSDAGMNTVLVTATDYSGNTTTAPLQVNVIDISSYGRKVDICYKGQTRRVSKNKVQSYLRKGASLGSCATDIAMNTGGVSLGQEETDPVWEPLIDLGAFPNPSQAETTIKFSSEVAGPATVAVMTTGGVKINTLFDGQIAAEENVTVRYNTAELPSGIYIVRLVTAGQIRNLKLMVKK